MSCAAVCFQESLADKNLMTWFVMFATKAYVNEMPICQCVNTMIKLMIVFELNCDESFGQSR